MVENNDSYQIAKVTMVEENFEPMVLKWSRIKTSYPFSKRNLYI